MKRFIAFAGAALLIASCNNNTKKGTGTPPEPLVVVKDTTRQVCNFNWDTTQFNKYKIVNKKPSKPPVPPPTTGDQTGGVILLDFDGYTVTNTSWNFYGPIMAMPANLDSVTMQYILDSTVKKYAPWKVIVTTDEAVYNAANSRKRIRLLYTETYEWFGAGAGGTSFVGSFTWGDNTPCFVFTSLLGYNPKYIMEAGVHEIGHSLGLYHQSTWDLSSPLPGIKLSEYNYGNGVNAPIMGCSYYVSMSKWVTGYNSYGTLQDDASKISAVIPKR